MNPKYLQPPADESERAALIVQLVCSAINLDHAARRLQELRVFSNNAKRRLNLLANASDAFMEAVTSQFRFADADASNVLSDVLTEQATLLMQCRPSQIQHVLETLVAYAQSNNTATLQPAQ